MNDNRLFTGFSMTPIDDSLENYKEVKKGLGILAKEIAEMKLLYIDKHQELFELEAKIKKNEKLMNNITDGLSLIKALHPELV